MTDAQRDAQRAVKTAQGYVAHHEALIRKWTERRDAGDGVPSKAILTAWIEGAEKDLGAAKSALDRAEREMRDANALG